MTDRQADPRWKAVIEWFGYRPNFHDAEVLSIELRRSPEPSLVRVHTWRTLDEVDEKGYYRQDRHAVVSFFLNGIVRQELCCWNHQNVLSKLNLTDGPEGAILTLEGTFGIEGEIVARELRVEIEPCSPRPDA